jgi:hypothetical protein
LESQYALGDPVLANDNAHLGASGYGDCEPFTTTPGVHVHVEIDGEIICV